MITGRNPMKDRVAFAGAATTGFVVRNTARSQASLAAEACTKVLRECGLAAEDVDGICGSVPDAPAVQSMLGIPEVTWFANPMIPFVNQVTAAASAVHSGPRCLPAPVEHALVARGPVPPGRFAGAGS
jgi:3-oxoacyl-[acyl-carrier-protein] synthase III